MTDKTPLHTVAEQVLRDMESQGVLVEWHTLLREAIASRDAEPPWKDVALAAPPPAQPAQPIQAHSKAQYKRLVAQGANALPPQPPQAEPLSEADIVRSAVESGCVGTVKMTFDSGPYEITRTSINADRFARAIERLITERAAKEQGS